MTVPTSNSKSGPYAGAGTTGPFTVDFRFLRNEDLRVVRTSVDAIETTLVLDSDYSVSGAGAPTGTVTLTMALAVGQQLTIVRQVMATQEANYVQNDAFPADSHERALDKLTMLVQQESERLDRSIKIAVSDPALTTTLPPVNDRANKLLSFDADGNPQVVAPDAQSATALALQYAEPTGSSFIGFLQAGPGAVPRTMEDKGRDIVSVFDFFSEAQKADARSNAPVLDHTAAIQLAFGSTVFNTRCVTIPDNVTLRITAPIQIPCGACFVGAGGASRIRADYGSWVGTDYRAIVVNSREGVNYLGREYNQVIGNFSLFGLNNSSVVSTGISFHAVATIAPALTVNYSFYGGTITRILVSGFDTAYSIKECWNTTFDNIYSMFCRAGILIAGKSVNLTFSEVRLTNFGNANTSSVAATQGVDIRSGFHYAAGAEGRPEGVAFTPGSLIFGADTNLYVSQCLYFRITDSIIDGGTAFGVRIGTADNVTIRGNYIYVSAVGGKGVSLDSVGTSDSQVFIQNNHFVGSGAASQVGVDIGNGIRRGVAVVSNFFLAWERPIFLNNAISCEVIANYGRSNSSEMILVQSGCENTVIDRNTSDDAFAILLCQPSTSAMLDIRSNASPTTKTFARGKVTLLAGTTSIAIPSGLHSGAERFLRAYTSVKPSANVGAFWVVDPISTSSTATFNCSVAPGADVTIYYEAQAIPSSAL